MRIYRHLNPEAIEAHPEHSTRIRITSSSDVRNWLRQTRQKPDWGQIIIVTFVIDTDGWFWIADRHSEHLACAAGRDVRSAGEITFDCSQTEIFVSEVSNQSLGYCPEPDSWPAVDEALNRAGISHPPGFTTEFVFRLCTKCHTKNIVKDKWFECVVCGTPLDQIWNF
ncbi:MAG: hypothetical protein HY774_14460 [Acidobacteria bacterium]|nr:hypothetical protein [Acidobacteriota bacterium]